MEGALARTAWERIGIRTHHGINIPLFSLRSKDSLGIGDFLDLKLLIDWVESIGFDIIQLLPLYDSGVDPSPYNALSANALNPIYISLQPFPKLHDQPEAHRLRALNQAQRLHYLDVLELKLSLLRKAYRDSPAAPSEHELQFYEENEWLDAYADFKGDDPPFYKWLQWIAFSQMASMKRYAEEHHVLIKGDIPILVSPDSVDVKSHPDIFDLSLVAGAPPDMYNEEGQRWGFPLYCYDALVKQHFHFWIERLASATPLYHLYRLDHIVGLFRIWGIPSGKLPKEGHYVPVDRALWRERGQHYLETFLQHCPLLPVGEDLGIIPHETRETMAELGIPGTKVMRWERHWKGDHSFIPYSEYPVNSMTTVSTHDSPPLKLWWMTHPEEARDFARFNHWEYEPHLSNRRLFDLLYISHHTPSLLHINLLNEYLSLFEDLHYPDYHEERINHPGTISTNNWSYRTKAYLEDIVTHQSLKTTMQELIR